MNISRAIHAHIIRGRRIHWSNLYIIIYYSELNTYNAPSSRVLSNFSKITLISVWMTRSDIVFRAALQKRASYIYFTQVIN